MASFEDWLETFDEVYRAMPGGGSVACPNCGHRELRLVFTVRPGSDVGYAAFWCDNCLEGIHISRAVVPAGAVVRDASLPSEGREPKIPNYHVVG
jgi:hypothetical protein